MLVCCLRSGVAMSLASALGLQCHLASALGLHCHLASAMNIQALFEFYKSNLFEDITASSDLQPLVIFPVDVFAVCMKFCRANA